MTVVFTLSWHVLGDCNSVVVLVHLVMVTVVHCAMVIGPHCCAS